VIRWNFKLFGFTVSERVVSLLPSGERCYESPGCRRNPACTSRAAGRSTGPTTLIVTRRDDLSTAPTRLASTAACAASAERISASVWPEAGANAASNVRAVLVGCLTARPVSSPRRADQGEAAQRPGVPTSVRTRWSC
jgi:hypothetical protein